LDEKLDYKELRKKINQVVVERIKIKEEQYTDSYK